MPRFPNRTLEERAIAAGANVRCMWQIKGPKDTGVAWLECLQIGPRGDVVIVETFHHGGWNAFSAPHSNRVDDTIADVLERCGVKPAATFKVDTSPGEGFAQFMERQAREREQGGADGR